MMVGRQTFSIKNGSFSDDIRSIFWGFHPIGGTETSDVLGEWAVCQVDAKAEAHHHLRGMGFWAPGGGLR